MIGFTFKDEFTGEEVTVPGLYILCPDCEGEGTELRGGLKGAAFSAEDIAEDPEFFEDYFEGRYDVACSRCHGRTSIIVPDVGRCTFAEKRILASRRRSERYARQAEAERRYFAERGIQF